MQPTMITPMPFYVSKELLTDKDFGMYEKMIIQYGKDIKRFYPSIFKDWKHGIAT
jgi:hypothetical protein